MTQLVRLVSLIALMAVAPAYAGQDFESCFAMEAAAAGTVDSVREVEAPRDLHAFDPDVLEHKLRAETSEVVVVRLDAGPLLVLDPGKARRFRAGERVVVAADGTAVCHAPLVELAQRLF